MLKPYQPPSGKINTKRRSFEEVVRDLRRAVFAVTRHRQVGEQEYRAWPLGTGFFVGPDIFITCNHVMNHPSNPHADGDTYRLVRMEHERGGGVVHQVTNIRAGENLFLYPDADFAVLRAPAVRDQAFAALDYGSWPIGKEIGVAGYPLPNLTIQDGQLRYDGLIFRVAKGVITSTYPQRGMQLDTGQVVSDVSIIEVNFLFVPGNSGGPVFDAETGRVGGFVQGYRTTKIREKVEQVTMLTDLPNGLGRQYVENLNALYSVGIRIECVRTIIENFGVRI
jgi:Trypsin-like peptidase domain